MITFPASWPRPAGSRRTTRGFTLPELMVVAVVFSLAALGAVYLHLFGLRMRNMTEAKLASTEDARRALNRIRDEIRTAKMVTVGSGDAGCFEPIGLGQPQAGNALQIHPTTNTSVFTRYYLDPDDDSLKRIAHDDAEPAIVARYLTNRLAFQAEHFDGTVLTNNRANRTIRMTLEFYRIQYPVVTIGPGSLYDYYRLQTKVTRRSLE